MKYVLFIIIFVSLIYTTTSLRTATPELKPKFYPVKEMNKLHFGFSNIVGDLLWLRVVQNIDFCENTEIEDKAYNKGTNLQSILNSELRQSRCHKGWVFQMLDLITDLAPKFRKVYRIGSELLSVAVDDREGARVFFEKGLKEFPDYWELAYSASYHYLFEYQDPKRAADLLIQASDAGGPFWFRQMAGTLFTKAGQFVVAEATLKSYVVRYWDKRGKGQAVMRLKELYIEKGLSPVQAESKVNSFLVKTKKELDITD